jgi:transcriptional regulator with XRE-family HTH domain
LGENLRLLLWRDNVDRSQWADRVAGWVGCDRGRADDLLDGRELKPYEQERIAERFCVSEEELQYGQLFQDYKINVLDENLRYLIGTLDHGQSKQLAMEIGVSPVTVSRWATGKQVPEESKLVALCRSFGLPAGTDLRSEPLFLSRVPVSDRERKTWLHHRIDALDPQTLRELFPALRRLLKDR